MPDTIDENGEVVSAAPDTGTIVSLARAEIDMQVATALAHPRRVATVAAKIMTLATMDEETAEECCYALVYGKKQKDKSGAAVDDDNKPVEGPSIRLAEMAAQCWGNNRSFSRVLEVNRIDKYVVAEGIFHDLETNAMTMMQVRRRIAGTRGNLYPEHLIITTANAACSIAKRNAILAGIPRGIYRPAYKKAREIIAGTVATLSVNRDKAITAFAAYAIKPEQILALFGLDSLLEMRVDHIAQLRALYSSIKNEEVKVEEIFAPARPPAETVADPLSDEVNHDQTSTEQGPAAQTGAAPDGPAKGGADAGARGVADAAPKTEATKTEKRTEPSTKRKTYPFDELIAAFAAVTTWEGLEAAREARKAFIATLSPDAKQRAEAAYQAAQARLEAIDIENEQRDQHGQEDSGEEPEAGETVSDVSNADVVVGKEPAIDTGARRDETARVSPGKKAEAAAPAGDKPAAEPAGSTLDTKALLLGDWSDRERKFLSQAVARYAAVTSRATLLEADDYFREYLGNKSAECKEAYRQIQGDRVKLFPSAKGKL